MNRRPAVAYYHVGHLTDPHADVALSIYRSAAFSYADACSLRIVSEYVERSPRRVAWQWVFSEALAVSLAENARLIIPQAAHIQYKVQFLQKLAESGVSFTALDTPDLNPQTIQPLLECALILSKVRSERVRAALARAKAKGTKLGGKGLWPPDAAAQAKGVATNRAKADYRARELADTIAEIRAAGASSLRKLASELNRRGIPSPRQTAKGWSPMQVKRVLSQIAEAGS